ncbi:olfactomedin-like protein 2A [Lingula anatina]|uniref:Olfactomedin-like protein 2A n=1 Tax=Lingula anatina TaxID=7574 RepID=A0A1S3HNX8_LINAN|nr:olfactomedin-like protein 2A [Lingula anatina]|eukprot:XP_013387752.1 olfactomedin-like protein 2A [Lingula anatina]
MREIPPVFFVLLVFFSSSLTVVLSEVRSCSMQRLTMVGGFENTNRALSGSILTQHRVKSVRECTVRCLSTAGCVSFNYESAPVGLAGGFRSCELNNSTVWTAGLYRLVHRERFVYYEKVEDGGAIFVKPDCGAVPNVTNASTNVTDSTYVTSVTYKCSNGFDVQGSDTIYCQPDGTWETPPTCLISQNSRCGNSPVVDKATSSRDTSTDTVTYTCEPGYRINGTNPISCMINDVWEPAPSCEERGFPVAISITNKDVVHPSLGKDEGSWMTDTALDNGMVYITEKSHNPGKVIEYTSANFPYTNLPREIDVECDGTTHVIRDGYLFCGQHNNLNIMKYRLTDGQALTTGDLPSDAGVHDVYPYTCASHTDIDVAADEHGLWVVYANTSNNIVVSRLDPETLDISDTRVISDHAKTNTAETFIIDGVLFAINSSPTNYVSYVYDLFRGSGKTLTSTDLPLASGSLSADTTWDSFTMVDYNPRDGKLYVYSEGKAIRYDVTLTF